MGILDMDGFCVGGQFLCKELGMWKIGNIYAESHFFDIGMRWGDLDAGARRQCSYVIRNVHRLPFGVPEGSGAVKLGRLEEIVLGFYHRHRTDVACLFAYKGGCYGRDLLDRLGVPGINLETGINLGTGYKYGHCPKVETEAFGLWLSKRLQQVRNAYVL
jgi:hypothetical protein